ncbi:sigma-70 family RNA polymerase sigma factor [Clostridium estertheticum]|uniref:Sigma-70 family RNA polymerase sigma factor n=1 Tax=Clostridium estertheticum TaxID=238834 RepID=A0A5N7IJQ1_9CLOT|nr:sigma-70 family RNA polymerase sigma factor [Clostridium estertheticum]MPQ61177.1 sigma-70 family RNA polymerase sigma factor [Clostridium estertheticum]
MKSNEENYIRRLKNKKEDALEFIVDKYLALVKSTVYKVLSPLKRDGIIEECINDVFFSIWNHSGKFKGGDVEFKKWIYKIAKFRAIDCYRKEIKNTEVSLERDISGGKSIEDEIIITEGKDELIVLINSLESIDRDIFIMKFFLDVKSDAIAKKFGMSRAAIDNRIYRGKKKLSKKVTSLNLEVV